MKPNKPTTKPQPPAPVMGPRVMFLDTKYGRYYDSSEGVEATPVLVRDWSEAGQSDLRHKFATAAMKWERQLEDSGPCLSLVGLLMDAIAPREPRKKGGAK